MKKFFVIALAAMSLTVVSCKKSVEDQAKEYAEKVVDAFKSGDMAKIQTIGDEAEKWMAGLSEADQAKAKAIMEEATTKAAQELFGGLAEELEDATDELDEAGEAVEEAIDEAGEAVEEAIEEAGEE